MKLLVGIGIEDRNFCEVEFMRRIYILLAQVDSWVMKGIRFYTRARYNHVSISLDGNMKTFYSFGRKVMSFPLIGGLIREELNQGLYRHFKNPNCLIYSLDISDEAYERIVELLQRFLQDEKRYKYNFAAMLGVVIQKPLRMKNRYTCSEFVSYLLSQSGVCQFETEAPLVTPDHFCRLKGLVRVYEGPMPAFNP